MDDTLVQRLAAERSPTAYTAALVARVEFSLQKDSRKGTFESELLQVPEHIALEQFTPEDVRSYRDLSRYTSRFETYWLRWSSSGRMRGEERILTVLTQLDENRDDIPALARRIKEGRAVFTPAVHTDQVVGHSLLERLDTGRTHLLESAGHTVTYSKQERILFIPTGIRIRGFDTDIECVPFYETGNPPLLPRPATLKEAERYLDEAVL